MTIATPNVILFSLTPRTVSDYDARMKLNEYLSRVGDEEAAKLFSVKKRTAISWRLGQRSPSPSQAFKIEELTKGVVSFVECYNRDDAA